VRSTGYGADWVKCVNRLALLIVGGPFDPDDALRFAREGISLVPSLRPRRAVYRRAVPASSSTNRRRPIPRQDAGRMARLGRQGSSTMAAVCHPEAAGPLNAVFSEAASSLRIQFGCESLDVFSAHRVSPVLKCIPIFRQSSGCPVGQRMRRPEKPNAGSSGWSRCVSRKLTSRSLCPALKSASTMRRPGRAIYVLTFAPIVSREEAQPSDLIGCYLTRRYMDFAFRGQIRCAAFAL
jgi:hypothetical protein